MHQRTRGFTLVEVLIAFVLLGGLVTFLVQVMDSGSKSQKGIEVNATFSDWGQDLRLVLNDPSLCTTNFANRKFDKSVAGAQTMLGFASAADAIKLPNGTPLLHAGLTKNGLTLNTISFTRRGEVGSTHYGTLTITAIKPSSVGGSEKSLSLNVAFDTVADTGTLVKIRSCAGNGRTFKAIIQLPVLRQYLPPVAAWDDYSQCGTMLAAPGSHLAWTTMCFRWCTQACDAAKVAAGICSAVNPSPPDRVYSFGFPAECSPGPPSATFCNCTL